MTPSFIIPALLVAAAGIIGLVLGAIGNLERAALSYLTAYVFLLTLALGSLVFLIIGHVTNARWFIVVRRVSERAATVFPALAVLFLPIAIGLGHLYPWAMSPENMDEHTREAVERHPAWFAPSAVLLRAALYFLVWIVSSELLLRGSLAQRERPWSMTTRLRWTAAASIWPFAIATTFAGFDWVMSLQPGFGSTTFGLYLFATSIVSGIALLVVLVYVTEGSGALRGRVSTSHYYAMGRLLLTFVIFWAYIAFTQFLIIYMADLPEEVTFYTARTKGPWYALGFFLMIARFGIPFFALLSRKLKFQPPKLAAVAGFILLGTWADVAWLVLPALHHGELSPSWLDGAAVLAVGGVVVAFGAWRARGGSAVPEHDPDLGVSEAYRRT